MWTAGRRLLHGVTTPYRLSYSQLQQRVHQILNLRGGSIKVVRHIMRGKYSYMQCPRTNRIEKLDKTVKYKNESG